jgi:YesN/AraC family two-component response regulator
MAAGLPDKERLLLASLRRGDSGEARKTVRDMLNDLSADSGDNFEWFKLKAMEMVVLLSRTGANAQSNEKLLEASGRFMMRLEDSQTAREVTENLCLIVEQMAGNMFFFQGIRHASALRKAERFIWENYTRKISLKEIADVSGLSASYFSSVFNDEMGESLSDYLNHLRVEKASAMLRGTECSINVISAACGFEDQSWFSKIFKSFTGISPGKYRELDGMTACTEIDLAEHDNRIEEECLN